MICYKESAIFEYWLVAGCSDALVETAESSYLNCWIDWLSEVFAYVSLSISDDFTAI